MVYSTFCLAEMILFGEIKAVFVVYIFQSSLYHEEGGEDGCMSKRAFIDVDW